MFGFPYPTGQDPSKGNVGRNSPAFIFQSSGDIAAGELVTLYESGKVARTNETLGMTLENNTTNGLTVVNASAAITSTNYASCVNAQQIAWLGSGNYVQAYTGDGATSTTGLSLLIKNSLGNSLYPVISVSSAASIGTVRVAKLSSSQFLVAWSESTTFKFAIYNNDGSVAVAAATIATLSASTPETNNVGVLATGDIVFAYQKTASTDLAFKRYSSLGVLQGSETVIEAASAGRQVAIRPCASGDFIVFYYRSAATAVYKFARYTSAGVISGSVTSLGTSTTEYTRGKPNGAIVELTNLNIAMVACAPGSANASIYIYNPSNVLVSRIDFAAGSHSSAAIPQLVKTDGGMALVGLSSADLTMQVLTVDGGIVTAVVTLISMTTGAGAGTNIDAYNIGVGFVVAVCTSTGGGSYNVRLIELDTLLAAKGSGINLEATGATLNNALSSAMSPNYLLVTQYTSSTSVKSSVYKCLRSSVFGVSQFSAGEGSNVTANTAGSFQLPGSQRFINAGTFDQRTATIPGNRGIIAGNGVYLAGLT